jgi:glycosyltransferase involved in cell wall biosynthesis
MRDYLVRTYEATADKIAVIPNWATTKVRKPGVASSDHFNRFNVVYSGNLGQLHDFDTILDAAELLHGNSSVRFLIVGDGARAEWLRQEVRRRNLPNVVMKPFLPDPEFAELLGEASLGVISLEPGMEPLGVPSKMYNFLAAGVPLLAISGPDSEVARIIGERKIGYLVAHGDARSFASSVLDAYQNRQRWLEMSKNARAYAYAEARLDVAARRYAEELLRARLSASARRSK